MIPESGRAVCLRPPGARRLRRLRDRLERLALDLRRQCPDHGHHRRIQRRAVSRAARPRGGGRSRDDAAAHRDQLRGNHGPATSLSKSPVCSRRWSWSDWRSSASSSVPGIPVGAGGAPAPASAGFRTFTALVLACQGVIYTYDGWNGLLYFGGEVKNPGRDIPRSMAGGVLAVIAIYLLLNVAFLRVLPCRPWPARPWSPPRRRKAIFGPTGDTVVRVVILLSLFSAANAILLIGSRLPYGLSRDGLLAPGHEQRQPGRNAGARAAGHDARHHRADRERNLQPDSGAGGVLSTWCSTRHRSLSVLVLRKREPDLPRPYRAVGYPWVTGFWCWARWASWWATCHHRPDATACLAGAAGGELSGVSARQT